MNSNPDDPRGSTGDPFSMESIPWPKPEDQLIAADEPDHWNNAWISANRGNRWSLYAIGYKQAADLVVDKFMEDNGVQDYLVYPAMFLYRQYLELEIKDLILSARNLLDEPELDNLISHDISAYWKICCELLERVSPGDSVEELKHIARIVDEFSHYDPSSFAFRYPVTKPDRKTKERKPTLEGLETINLRNVKNVIANVAALLGAAGDQIYEYMGHKADMYSDYGSDF